MRKNLQNIEIKHKTNPYESNLQLLSAPGFSPFIKGYEAMPKNDFDIFIKDSEDKNWLSLNKSNDLQYLSFLENTTSTNKNLNSPYFFYNTSVSIEEYCDLLFSFLQNHTNDDILGINFSKNIMNTIALTRATRWCVSQLFDQKKIKIAIFHNDYCGVTDFLTILKTAQESSVNHIFINNRLKNFNFNIYLLKNVYLANNFQLIDPWSGNLEIEKTTEKYASKIYNSLKKRL